LEGRCPLAEGRRREGGRKKASWGVRLSDLRGEKSKAEIRELGLIRSLKTRTRPEEKKSTITCNSQGHAIKVTRSFPCRRKRRKCGREEKGESKLPFRRHPSKKPSPRPKTCPFPVIPKGGKEKHALSGQIICSKGKRERVGRSPQPDPRKKPRRTHSSVLAFRKRRQSSECQGPGEKKTLEKGKSVGRAEDA